MSQQVGSSHPLNPHVNIYRIVCATLALMSVLVIYDGWSDLTLLQMVGVIVGRVFAMFLGHSFSAAISRQAEYGRVLSNSERVAVLRSEAPFLLLLPAEASVLRIDCFGVRDCVVNLAADKDLVLREAHRVLRPGGLFAISDVVLLRSIPSQLQGFMSLWTGCVAGALEKSDYESTLTAAGFSRVEIEPTLIHDRAAIEHCAANREIPDEIDRDEAREVMDGAVAVGVLDTV